MPKSPVIMRKTQWKFGRGADPARVVLVKYYAVDDTVKEYSTHLEVDHRVNPGGKLAMYSGHYFRKLSNAKADFLSRKLKEGL
jgi:hypothetical protein